MLFGTNFFQDDVEEMKVRAQQNKLFVYIKIPGTKKTFQVQSSVLKVAVVYNVTHCHMRQLNWSHATRNIVNR